VSATQWHRQDFCWGEVGAYRGAEGQGADGVEYGEGLCPVPPQKIFDYLILKRRILIHIWGIWGTH